MKRLIVNADDFGFTRDVNAGIIECHRNGIVTAATLMANGAAFENAVRLAKENPTLDVGVHVVLVGGPGQPAAITGLLSQIARGQVDLDGEMRRQVQTILDAGIQPTHLDTHKHTHLIPNVLRALTRTSQEFGVPWIRKPADFPMPLSSAPFLRKAVNAGVRFAARRFDSVLRQAGCRVTDHFTGFEITGRLGTSELISAIEHLPEGSTELMCHPAFLGEELRQSATRLKESRERELRALTAPETRAALAENEVQLTTYRDL